jgi:HSP20 family protein
MLWQPFHDARLPDAFRTLRTLHGGLEQLLAWPAADPNPPITVYTKDEGCLVRALVPGLTPADIELEVDGDELSISGQWPGEPQGAEVVARHAERPTGRFSRRLRLPFEVNAAMVEARMERGVLEIQLSRTPDRKARRIEVQTNGSTQTNGTTRT